MLEVTGRRGEKSAQSLFVVFPTDHKQSSECKQKLTPTFIFFFFYFEHLLEIFTSIN